MSSVVLLPRDFDPSRISITEMKTLNNGNKTAYISYDGQPLNVQTPEMRSPFGVNPPAEKYVVEGQPDKYSIDLSFDDMHSRKGVKAFHDMINTLDGQLVEWGTANSVSLFKKQHPSATVEALYTPMVKLSKDPTRYPPTFKASVPHKDGEFTCEVYNASREKVKLDMADLTWTKGSGVVAIARCVGVWSAGSKFGVSWKVQQLKIVPSPVLRGYAFVGDEDDGPVGGGDGDEEDDDGDIVVPQRTRNLKRQLKIAVPSSGDDGAGGGGPIDGVPSAPRARTATSASAFM